jgi:molybdate transport system substrate-binding protein
LRSGDRAHQRLNQSLSKRCRLFFEAGKNFVAEIKVLSAGAMQSMVALLGADFERETGHKLNLNFGTAGALRERLKGGEQADLAVLPDLVIASLEKEGMFVSGSRVDLGRTVTGVAVKEGAPLPDISTSDAFKKALLDARSVAYVDPAAGGSSGTFFAGLLERLNVATEIAAKAVLGKRGDDVARSVAEGRAEVGVTFISELLPHEGVRIVGPLPAEIANANVYSAAILASASRELAAALLRKLADPSNCHRWTDAGIEPLFG